MPLSWTVLKAGAPLRGEAPAQRQATAALGAPNLISPRTAPAIR